MRFANLSWYLSVPSTYSSVPIDALKSHSSHLPPSNPKRIEITPHPWNSLLTYVAFSLHAARHSAVPAILPVPTPGMVVAVLLTSTEEPRATFTRSEGRPKRPFTMLCVPWSSFARAETSWAFSQPARDGTVRIAGLRCWGVLKELGLTGVDHGVYTSLREDGHLPRRQGVGNNTCSVLLDEVRDGRPSNGDDIVGCSRMVVWWEHRAGAE